MYPDVKLVQQHLRPVHPKKATSIKAEIEKLLHDVPFTLFHLPIGFPILFLSCRNKEQYECVLIIGMLITLVQKTTIPLPLSTR